MANDFQYRGINVYHNAEGTHASCSMTRERKITNLYRTLRANDAFAKGRISLERFMMIEARVAAEIKLCGLSR